VVVRVQYEDFDIAAETDRLVGGRHDVGAIVTFTGKVRGDDGGRPIAALTLEHYPEMTEAEMVRIEAEARSRWPVQEVLVVHRVGELRAGENIVLVITVAPHRQAAFDAAGFLMDYLKTRAPFWKKETAPDGKGTWVEAHAGDDTAAERWR